ncbi:MAG: hypothetical protein GXY36_12380 [Chloroflexi bacterium]|nr:hypothetical protein [Chloroflexota bacterium]
MRHNRISLAVRRLGLIVLLVSLLPVGLLAAQEPEIDQGALLHDSRDNLYRTPGGAVVLETPVTLRFRTAAGDVDGVSVRVFDDRTDTQSVLPMAVVTTTPDGYDLWELTLDTGRQPTIYWYRFLITKGDQTLYYEDDTRPDGGNFVPAREGGPGAVYTESPDLSYQITVYRPDFYTPEWMRNGVIYQIFPDRFRNGDVTNDPEDGSELFYGELPLFFHETWNEPPIDGRVETVQSGVGYYNSDFYGGDLAGIIEKLDYLEDLGVTAIYLNPIFEARSNHRYDTADFKAIDPILGDMETFQTLVAEAEARGMVVILDGVFNHLSSDSLFFDRYNRFEGTEGACESLESPWRGWFFFTPPRANQPSPCVDTPNDETYYVSWAGFDSIPKINNTQLGPREYFFLDEDSVARLWGEAGIGGWRLDVAGDIDPGGPDIIYWEAFRSIVRQVNPESVIIGEEWADASRWLLGNEWDSTMNYRLRNGIIGFVRDEMFTDNDANGDRIIYALTPSETDAIIRAIEEDYPPMAYHALMNLLDSHDTTRLFFAVDNDPQRQKLAALLQFTLPGAPTVYYGDEIAIDAPSIPDSGGNLQDDPYNRAPYPWPDTAGDFYPPPDEDMLAHYQQIAALRHANPALREGAMITLVTDDAAGVYAFLRVDAAAGNAALVVLNNSDSEQAVDLDLAGLLPTGLTLTPLFEADPVSTEAGSASVTVGAHSGNVWTVTAEPFTPPAAPASVQAEGVFGSANLTWEPVEGAAGYIVYRSPVATGGFEPITASPVQDTGYADETVANGFRYYYAVAAVGENGLRGELSASALAIPSAQIEAAFYVGDDATDPETTYEPTVGATHTLQAAIRIPGMTEAGGPAVGVRAEAAMVASEAELADADWLPMTYAGELNNADLYAVDLAPQAAGEYLTVARFSTNAGESWQVVTHRDGSLPALVVEPSNDTEPPQAPASVTVRRASASGVIVAWEPSPSEDVFAYRIYRSGEDGESALVGEAEADAAQFVDRTVAEGQRYRYGVAAVDASLNESEIVWTEDVLVQRLNIPVTFIVEVPEYTEGEVFIAGSFGTTDYPSWDPAGLQMEQLDPTHWSITLDLPEGANVEFKFVRGTWDAVEKGTECEEIANRRLKVEVGEDEDALTVDDLVVAKWRDLDACG